jgi:DinB superfamily
MHSDQSAQLRQQLLDAIRGHQAHLDFETAVDGFPPDLRGVKPPGAPHSAWQLLEHIRIAQHDILAFSRDANHKSPPRPEGYWPKTDAPPDQLAWDKSVAAVHRDGLAFNALVQDLSNDLFKPFAHGDGQTLLREALLIASHNSYHLGQLVYLRKILEAKG